MGTYNAWRQHWIFIILSWVKVLVGLFSTNDLNGAVAKFQISYDLSNEREKLDPEILRFALVLINKKTTS